MPCPGAPGSRPSTRKTVPVLLPPRGNWLTTPAETTPGVARRRSAACSKKAVTFSFSL
jgi:hypothetical protein